MERGISAAFGRLVVGRFGPVGGLVGGHVLVTCLLRWYLQLGAACPPISGFYCLPRYVSSQMLSHFASPKHSKSYTRSRSTRVPQPGY